MFHGTMRSATRFLFPCILAVGTLSDKIVVRLSGCTEWATVQPGMVCLARKKKTAVFRQYVAAETAVPVISCAACLPIAQEKDCKLCNVQHARAHPALPHSSRAQPFHCLHAQTSLPASLDPSRCATPTTASAPTCAAHHRSNTALQNVAWVCRSDACDASARCRLTSSSPSRECHSWLNATAPNLHNLGPWNVLLTFSAVDVVLAGSVAW